LVLSKWRDSREHAQGAGPLHKCSESQQYHAADGSLAMRASWRTERDWAAVMGDWPSHAHPQQDSCVPASTCSLAAHADWSAL
jgi:hypothetical protein